MQTESKGGFRVRVNEEALALSLVPTMIVGTVLASYLSFDIALIVATILFVFLYGISCGIAALWSRLFSRGTRDPAQQSLEPNS
jgi:hypothetical protein